MLSRRFVRPAGTVGAMLLFAALMIAGCSDATGPDTDPLNVDNTTAVSDPIPNSEADSVRANVEANQNDTITVGIDSVINIVLGEFPDGEVMGLRLDFDRDTVNYEVVVRSGNTVWLVTVDPKSGKVIDRHPIDNYNYSQIIIVRIIHDVHIKVHDARERAKKKVKGDVVEVNFEEIDGAPTYVIVILTGGNRYVTVYIDARDGSYRDVRDDCDDDGDTTGDHHEHHHGRGHYRHGNGYGYGHRWHCGHDNGGGDTTHVRIGLDSVRTIVTGYADSLVVDTITADVRAIDTVYYQVQLSRDSSIFHVTLDAFTGQLVMASQDTGDFTLEFQPTNVRGGDTLVALSVARTAALANYAGTITRWQLAYSDADSAWVYTFTVDGSSGGATKQVLVNASTGVFMRLE